MSCHSDPAATKIAAKVVVAALLLQFERLSAKGQFHYVI